MDTLREFPVSGRRRRKSPVILGQQGPVGLIETDYSVHASTGLEAQGSSQCMH